MVIRENTFIRKFFLSTYLSVCLLGFFTSTSANRSNKLWLIWKLYPENSLLNESFRCSHVSLIIRLEISFHESCWTVQGKGIQWITFPGIQSSCASSHETNDCLWAKTRPALSMLIVNMIPNNKYIWVDHHGFLEKSFM